MSKSIQGANRVPSLPRSEGDDRCLFSTCRPTCAGSMSLMERVKRDLNVRHSLKCDLGLIDEFFSNFGSVAATPPSTENELTALVL